MSETIQYDEPDVRLDQLAASSMPSLIGVRHHSAILAARMNELLEHAKPKRICIELPLEFEEWIEWIAHSETVAPIALAASSSAGDLFFYPLADFSPELAAIRWSVRNNVPVEFIDLPLAFRNRPSQNPIDSGGDADSQETTAEDLDGPDQESESIRPDYIPWQAAIDRHLGTSDTVSLWERLVESPGMNASPESARRAALLFGLIIRDSQKVISERDRLREAWMRHRLKSATANVQKKTVAVVGSFHAAALVPDHVDKLFDEQIEAAIKTDEQSKSAKSESPDRDQWKTALIPYSFGQLDSRSGYPAGVLDPVWHQSIWESADDLQRSNVLKRFLVEVCRDLRRRGVNASTADAISAMSMAEDLSRVRNLGSPGRSELHEAITSTLVQGEQIGRRRQVSAAARSVLIGHRLGQLSPDSPRSGLVPYVEDLLKQLRLPGADSTNQKPKRMRLDPLRNSLDRSRSVTLQRLAVLEIPYAKRIDDVNGPQGPRENLTEHWEISWQHATTARLYTLATHGINLQQAAAATIRRWSQKTEQEGELTPVLVLSQLAAAARCGIGVEVQRAAKRINDTFSESASLSEIVSAANWFKRICNGLIPGLPLQSSTEAGLSGSSADRSQVVAVFSPDELQDRSHLLATAIARLEGVAGTDKPDDARAVLELVSWIESADEDWPVDGGLRIKNWLRQTTRQGSPLMQGVTLGCQMRLAMVDENVVAATTISWWDQASSTEGRTELTGRLSGWIFAAGSRIIGDHVWLNGIDTAIEQASDSQFLHRLLPLHFGFRSFQPKQRERLLQAKLAALPEGSVSRLPVPKDPLQVAANRDTDRLARAAIARVLPNLELRTLDPQSFFLSEEKERVTKRLAGENELTLADRWRLILGGKPDSPKGSSVRNAFGDLFGEDDQSGGGDLLTPQERSGGTEAPEVDSRKWSERLEKLLGSQIAEEVMIEAAAKGRLAAFQVINPKRTPANPDLLRQILSMHSQAEGAMLERLRAIAKNISDRLAKMLAIRLQPHLTGLMTTRPRSRPSPMLDLPRTLQRNLKHTCYDDQGRRKIVAANPVFRTPATRNMDWSIHLVVDVSGSMETSTVYAALIASVFANLPSIDLQFITFSTEVADLSAHVDDPLSLLTEVRIGGGTHIALGLRAARDAIRVPRRAMVVLITDFHEGVSVPELIGEVRALSASGARLIGLAALDDQAAKVYHTGIAKQCVAAGMPVAALSPEQLADWVAKQIRGAGGA